MYKNRELRLPFFLRDEEFLFFSFRVQASLIYHLKPATFDSQGVDDMNNLITTEINNELKSFKDARRLNQVTQAWDFLERAHILGQKYWLEHLRVHVYMLKYAFQTRNYSEAMAQLPRIILAAPGSLLNKAPYGNVGTGRVGIFKKMKIPSDLQKILDKNS